MENKLNRFGDKVKFLYSETKNILLSYKKVKRRFSKRYDTFKIGWLFVARISVRGGLVKLYLNQDPSKLEPRYRIKILDRTGGDSWIARLSPIMQRAIGTRQFCPI